MNEVPQRKLAAILAADVVGYSRLMGEDEEATLAALKECRAIIDPLIETHGGRVFGSAGDSIIAEFASPVESVRCATEVQLALDKKNADVPDNQRMRFRMGINLGDVIIDGDNLMGDGVNIAARLEALAPPGGVYVSEAVLSQVQDRLGLDFLDLGKHAVKNIARPIRVYRVPLPSEQGITSPYRGLDTFEFEHANLLFGRAAAITATRERLARQAEAGTAFLLIYGMSGAGKSSLLRAGLLPSLIESESSDGIGLWRYCLFRPSAGSNPIEALASSLLSETALPNLSESTSATDLAKTLRESPSRALAVIRSALATTARAEKVNPRLARLIVAVDQMEELFTADDIDSGTRAEFIAILSTLARSGLAWVVGTIRADFFHRCGEVPGFSDLKDGLGSYELLAPTGPEIAQIIREPARAAGLKFEVDPSEGDLADVLQHSAIRDAGSLPLLEFVLDALYEAGKDRRLMTFAAYRALGGLEGAIARRADEATSALPYEVQNTLPSLINALTTVRQRDGVVTGRAVPRHEIALTAEHTALVDALVDARLLISAEDPNGTSIVRLAHEALLYNWPRARDIISANREFLAIRSRVRADARRWLAEHREPDLLLPSGKRLAEAEDMLKTRRDEIDEGIIEYVEASISAWQTREDAERKAERQRQEAEVKRNRLEAEAAKRLASRTRFAAVITLILAIIAGIGAVVGFIGQREAEQQTIIANGQTEKAEAEKVRAETARNETLLSQSKFLTDFTNLETKYNATGVLLALEALRDEKSSNPIQRQRPYWFKAEIALDRSIRTNRESSILKGHEDIVTGVAVSQDGSFIVTGSSDKTVRIWDAKTGTERAILIGHKSSVNSVAVSPDGSFIVIGSSDKTARIWDAKTGTERAILNGHESSVNSVAVSPDGTYIVTGSSDKTARIWDAKTGAERAILKGHEGLVNSVAVSPDGSFIVTGSLDKTARIWDAKTGTERAILKGHENAVNGVAVSPDGTFIVTGSWDKTARIWDAKTGTERAILKGHEGLVNSVAVSPDGTFIVTASRDRTARIWDTKTGAERAILKGHEKRVESVAVSPDGSFIVTGSLDKTARIWDAKTGNERAILKSHEDTVTSVAVSPDGSFIVTGSPDKTARIWNAKTGTERTILKGHEAFVNSVAVSPDGTFIVTGSSDGTARIWDAKTGTERAILKGHGSSVESVAVSRDGSFIVTGSWDKTARIWDAKTGTERAILKGHEDRVNSVAVSPDGSFIVTGSSDKTARIWGAKTGTERAILKGHESRVRSVAVSPDGTYIVTGSLDKTARVWDAKTGTERAILKGHESGVRSVVVSPDGSFIVTGSWDKTARIWDAKTGIERAILKGHEDTVTSVVVSPDGTFIVTGSLDKSTRVWDIFANTQSLVDHAKVSVVRCLSQAQRQRFNLVSVPPRWCITGPDHVNKKDPAKWQPKWPYHSNSWRDWLVAIDRGENPPLPKEQ